MTWKKYTGREKKYMRPALAQNYVNYDRVSIGGDFQQRMEERAVVPPLLQIRPLEYNWYAEVQTTLDAKPEVVCSGTPILLGGTAFGGNRIGIMKHDAVPGETVAVVTTGRHYLGLNYDGALGGAASNTTNLRGKPAYYIIELGKVSDQAPAGPYTGFQCGVFGDIVEEKPFVPMSGIWFAEVILSPFYDATALAAPAAAANADFTPTISIDVKVAAPTTVGYSQTFEARVWSNNPNVAVEAGNLTWNVNGTAYDGDFRVQHDFTADQVGATLSLVATLSDGSTLTANYTYDVAVGAAIANLTRV